MSERIVQEDARRDGLRTRNGKGAARRGHCGGDDDGGYASVTEWNGRARLQPSRLGLGRLRGSVALPPTGALLRKVSCLTAGGRKVLHEA